MLVIVSDLHLNDGTTGATLQPGAFSLFAERLQELARAASWPAFTAAATVAGPWLNAPLRRWSPGRRLRSGLNLAGGSLFVLLAARLAWPQRAWTRTPPNPGPPP